MKYEVLALLVFCAVAFGGLGYLFVDLTEGVNKPIGDGSTAQAVEVDEPAPPAGPIVEDDAPVILGSPSITTNAAHDEVTVDFFECIPGSGSLDFADGSVSFNMKGLEGNDCVVTYTVDGDNVTCRVPNSIGTRRFSITDETPDLGSIKSYCDAG
jgi:hypothetical protein